MPLGNGVHVTVTRDGYIRLRAAQFGADRVVDQYIFLDTAALDTFLTWLIDLREITLRALQDRLDGLNASRGE